MLSDKKPWSRGHKIAIYAIVVPAIIGIIGLPALYIRKINIDIQDLNNKFDTLSANKIKTNSLEVDSSTTTDANISNNLYVGKRLLADGAGTLYVGDVQLADDIGVLKYLYTADLTDTVPSGTRNSVCPLLLGAKCPLEFYGENTGKADSIQNDTIILNSKIRPDYAQKNLLDLGARDAAWRNLFVTSTSYMADIQAINSSLPTTTVSIGSESKASCIILGDINKKGLTYCTALNGILTCGTKPCNP